MGMSNLLFLYKNILEQSGTRWLNGPVVSYADSLGCTNGSASLTRKAGALDFTTAGVKFWSQLGGTISARFPAGTRVTNVTASTLTMSANATSTISNNPGEAGTFNPTQGLIELPEAPMSNLFDADPNTVWDPGPTAGGFGYPITIVFEFDLVGSTPATTAFLVNTVTRNLLLGGIDQIDIDSGTTYGTWTNRYSIGRPDSLRDVNYGIVGGTQFSARFWRFVLTISERATLGTLWLGLVDQDLGGVWPGTQVERIRPAAIARNPGGRPFYSRMGPDRRVFRFPWGSFTTAQRQQIEAVMDNRGLVSLNLYRQPVMVDDVGGIYPVEFVEQRIAYTKLFTGVESQELLVETT
jgi:hypothetical protein